MVASPSGIRQLVYTQPFVGSNPTATTITRATNVRVDADNNDTAECQIGQNAHDVKCNPYLGYLTIGRVLGAAGKPLLSIKV